MNNEYIYDGFLFTSKEDVERAKKERKQVNYLKEHMDGQSVDSLLALYEKANKERLFRTPVGLLFMRELYTKLQVSGVDKEKLMPVFVYANFEQRIRPQTISERQKEIEKEKTEKLKKNYRNALLVIAALAVAVVCMFIITLTSNQPNILNYERALQDKYAGWEQDLTERENALREREKNE